VLDQQERRRGVRGLCRAAGQQGGRRGRGWIPSSAGLGLAAAIALAACGGAHHAVAAKPSAAPTPAAPVAAPTPTATRTLVGAADWGCLNARERREMFVLHGPAHDRLAALSVGTGRAAVILAHQSSGSLCQWWPYARSLATRFRVVAFDFDGAGASPPGDGNYPGEVAAAAKWARHHGSRRIVLMGASMGGTAVMVAAAHLGHSIAGVIDLSGPANFAGMNALGAASRVHVPALFAYGTLDFAFAPDVRRVRTATATQDKPVVAIRTTDHGVDLLDPAIGYAKVRKAVMRFIRGVSRR
jgi:pimeloyl-ACP methyl ester carboxylesterase